MSVNLLGSFLVGLVVGFYAARSQDSMLRPVLAAGFLGGFTTFSSWMAETVGLLESGSVLQATLNIGFSLVFGLLTAVGGVALGRLL